MKPCLAAVATTLLLAVAVGKTIAAEDEELRKIHEECMTTLGLSKDDYGPGGKLGQDRALAAKLYLCFLRRSGIFDASDKFSKTNFKKRLSVNLNGKAPPEEVQSFIEAVSDDCGAKVEASVEPPEVRALLLARCISDHQQKVEDHQQKEGEHPQKVGDHQRDRRRRRRRQTTRL